MQGKPKPAASLYSLLAPQQPSVEFKGADQWELFNASTKRLVAGPLPDPELLFTTRAAKLRHVRPGKPPYVVFGVPKGTVVVSCGKQATVCPDAAPATRTSWWLFSNASALTKTNVTGAHADIDPAGGAVVLVDFDQAGQRRLRELTRTLYERGRRLQEPQHLAVVVGGAIRSMPQIDFTDTTLANGIGGALTVARPGSPRGAKRLALALEPLAVRFTRVR